MLTDNILIIPNQNLKERIVSSKLSQEYKYMLSLTERWYMTGNRPLVHTPLAYEDEISIVKLTYLANLYHEYVSDNSQEGDASDFFLALLGKPPWTVGNFDSWWNIEILEIEYELLDVQKNLTINDLQSIRNDNQRWVKTWLENLKSQKGS